MNTQAILTRLAELRAETKRAEKALKGDPARVRLAVAVMEAHIQALRAETEEPMPPLTLGELLGPF